MQPSLLADQKFADFAGEVREELHNEKGLGRESAQYVVEEYLLYVHELWRENNKSATAVAGIIHAAWEQEADLEEDDDELDFFF